MGYDLGRLQPEPRTPATAIPVGLSHGATGHDLITFHVPTSTIWIVFFFSLLT